MQNDSSILTCLARSRASKSLPWARYARVPASYAASSTSVAAAASSGVPGSSARAALDADAARSTAADCATPSGVHHSQHGGGAIPTGYTRVRQGAPSCCDPSPAPPSSGTTWCRQREFDISCNDLACTEHWMLAHNAEVPTSQPACPSLGQLEMPTPSEAHHKPVHGQWQTWREQSGSCHQLHGFLLWTSEAFADHPAVSVAGAS